MSGFFPVLYYYVVDFFLLVIHVVDFSRVLRIFFGLCVTVDFFLSVVHFSVSDLHISQHELIIVRWKHYTLAKAAVMY